MNAEIISIGDELTSGQRLDTNSQWLSRQLQQLGIHVLYHTTVGDDLADGVRAVREAVDRADVVVCTGGLGPTADDLTRQALAEAAGTELVLDSDVLQHLRALFARRGRPMPPANVRQAYFPKGSRAVPNPQGTAPGIDLTVARGDRTPSRLFALPGVPAEMQQMWQQTVRPALESLVGDDRRVIGHRRIKCFGVGESDLEQRLPDMIRRGRHPSVGITVSQATITLRITAEGPTAQACDAVMRPTVATIYRCLGDLVFGEEDEELQHAVLKLLEQSDQTLALAEWATGGLLASWLSAAGPANDRFVGGYVVRTAGALPKLVGQPAREPAGPEAVRGLAERCRDDFGAHFGLAVGPFPEADQEAGEVEVALAGPAATVVKSFALAGHPEMRTARLGKQALNLLRLTLLRPERAPAAGVANRPISH